MRRATDSRRTRTRHAPRLGAGGRTGATVAAVGLITLAVPGTVSAHIDPDPPEAQAGSRLSVGFTVEHGCAGSPTTQLDMRLPEGATDAAPEPPEGWSGSVDDDVVTFVGGPLPDHEELTFRVELTLPPTPDTTIFFPFVQRCDGGEIRWIDLPVDGSTDELDEPAPAMRLVGPVATTAAPTSVVPVTTSGASDAVLATPAPGEPESVAATTTTTPQSTAATGPAAEPSDPPTTITETTVRPDDSGGAGAVLIATIVGVAIVVSAAAIAVRRRR